MLMFSFKKFEKTYNVFSTKHIYEKRKDSIYSRNHNFTDEHLYDILSQGISEGLTQFRNTLVEITFYNTFHQPCAILCRIDSKNNIILISMLENSLGQVNGTFKQSHTVFLKNYIFDKYSGTNIDDINIKIVKKPINKFRKKIKKIDRNRGINKVDISKINIDKSEDDIFLKSMKNISKLKIE